MKNKIGVMQELLKEIASEGKHACISTGMTTYDDIQTAVDIFRVGLAVSYATIAEAPIAANLRQHLDLK